MIGVCNLYQMDWIALWVLNIEGILKVASYDYPGIVQMRNVYIVLLG